MTIRSLDVHVATLPAVPLAVVQSRVSRATVGATVRESCGVVWAFARERMLPAGRNVAVYWDGSIRLEAGVELNVPFEEGHGVVRSATPAGPTASVTLVGPYDQLGLAHAAVREWCKAHGHELAGPNWEIYGHWQAEWNTNPLPDSHRCPLPARLPLTWRPALPQGTPSQQSSAPPAHPRHL
ncbi:MAG: GyrI-like domain-containing protein [Gemmatimonadetes bacterium]|nr:GyrI-like domain-containing protein [Gemmatimonadota bacterium]